MKSIEYLKEKIQLLTSLPSNRKVLSPDLCAIGLDGNEIFVIRTHQTKTVNIESYGSVTYKENNLLETLSNLVDQYQLKYMPCCWVLSPRKYQLLLLEELPVTASEFQAAIRWKVRDLLHFPVEDAIIDTFPIPLAKIPNSKSVMMVAVSQKSYVEPKAILMNESGLNLKKISIPELSYRNITSLYETDQSSTALLYIHNKNSNLIITKDQIFYLSRRLDWGLDLLSSDVDNEQKNNEYLDVLTLELQRSIDYYQSQWRTSGLGRIVLASYSISPVDMASYLSKRLNITVENFNISNVANTSLDINQQEFNRHLAVVGGAIQFRAKVNAAGN